MRHSLVSVVGLLLLVFPAVSRADATTATAVGNTVSVRTAAAGSAIEFSPGTFDPGAGVDYFVRLRVVAGMPIVPGTGCSSQADGSVVCGTHLQTQLAFSGGDGADMFAFVAGGNQPAPTTSLYGGSGNDVLIGGPGADSLNGADGDDYLVTGDGVNSAYGGFGNDILVGGAGPDSLNGADGDDIHSGGPGVDSIYGGFGNDVLNGGPGSDSLNGADGDDAMNGGTGTDSEYGGFGDDTITDKDGSVDTINCTEGADAAWVDASDLTAECETKPAGAVDAIPPLVSVASPREAQHFSQGAVVASAVDCHEIGTAGLALCNAPAFVGTGMADTTFVLGAADHAANIAVAVVHYAVDPSPIPPGVPPGAPPAVAPGAIAGPVPAANSRLPQITPRRLVSGGRAYVSLTRWRVKGAVRHRFQWELCDAAGNGCVAIPRATRRSLRILAPMAGRSLRVTVTALGRRGVTLTSAASPTALVLSSTPVNRVRPWIKGRAQVGKFLVAKKGIWDRIGGVRYQYAWQRCDAAGGQCQAIPGATRMFLRLTEADVGATFVVVVTATSFKDRAAVGQATSLPTSPVA